MRLTLLLPLAVLTTPVAHAQETGTLIQRKAAQNYNITTGAARPFADAFGACLVSREKGRVAKLIDLPVDSKEHEKLFDSLNEYYDECVSDGTLRLSELTLRGSLFQALYLRDYAGSTATSFPTEIQTGYRQLYAVSLSDKARMYLSLENFGECVSRTDAQAVRALLRSVPSSAEEGQAVTALMPQLSACTTKDNTIRMTRSNLRGALAEGLYRLTRATAQQGAN
jgi:hypothetical protein